MIFFLFSMPRFLKFKKEGAHIYAQYALQRYDILPIFAKA